MSERLRRRTSPSDAYVKPGFFLRSFAWHSGVLCGAEVWKRLQMEGIAGSHNAILGGMVGPFSMSTHTQSQPGAIPGRYVIRFANKHKNFWLEELTSLLQLAGYTGSPQDVFDKRYMSR